MAEPDLASQHGQMSRSRFVYATMAIVVAQASLDPTTENFRLNNPGGLSVDGKRAEYENPSVGWRAVKELLFGILSGANEKLPAIATWRHFAHYLLSQRGAEPSDGAVGHLATEMARLLGADPDSEIDAYVLFGTEPAPTAEHLTTEPPPVELLPRPLRHSSEPSARPRRRSQLSK